MRRSTCAMLVTLGLGLGLIGPAMAWEETTFNSVPANIVDAPVERWHDVEWKRENRVNSWYLSFDDGGEMWIDAADPGVYWRASDYTEDQWVRYAKDLGFDDFQRVESLSGGSQWGAIVLAAYDGRPCVLLGVLDRDDVVDDEVRGGTLKAERAVCGELARTRFDEWKAWGESFTRVSTGYNAILDKQPPTDASAGSMTGRRLAARRRGVPLARVGSGSRSWRANRIVRRRVVAGDA